jgi:hypothetical protein
MEEREKCYSFIFLYFYFIFIRRRHVCNINITYHFHMPLETGVGTITGATDGATERPFVSMSPFMYL